MFPTSAVIEYFPVSSDFLDPVEPKINFSGTCSIHGAAYLVERDEKDSCRHACNQNFDSDKNNTRILDASVKY